MTSYYLIGAGGRVLEEIESDATLDEMDYQYVNGTQVQGVIPKDEFPDEIDPTPVKQDFSSCEGYEEGFQSDRILTQTD